MPISKDIVWVAEDKEDLTFGDLRKLVTDGMRKDVSDSAPVRADVRAVFASPAPVKRMVVSDE